MTPSARRLVLERLVPARPERVFQAWTDPDELKTWWGPKGVTCIDAAVDLRIGGSYRIANKLPDGSILWISGVFETIERPDLLTYTWVVETKTVETERVTVRFEATDGGTLVVVEHERIPSDELYDQHQSGWLGCLDGLVALFDQRPL